MPSKSNRATLPRGLQQILANGVLKRSDLKDYPGPTSQDVFLQQRIYEVYCRLSSTTAQVFEAKI